jgi:hypothetical protein
LESAFEFYQELTNFLCDKPREAPYLNTEHVIMCCVLRNTSTGGGKGNNGAMLINRREGEDILILFLPPRT